MAEPASKLTDRLHNEAGWLESFGVARTASGLAVLLNEAASALERKQEALLILLEDANRWERAYRQARDELAEMAEEHAQENEYMREQE